MSTLNILLIDESVEEFQIIDRMLQDRFDGDYVLRHAKTIGQGTSILETQSPDVILLDSHSGCDLSAPGFTRELKANTSNAPMILKSTEIDAAYLNNGPILDIYDVVDKFDLRNIIAKGLLKGL